MYCRNSAVLRAPILPADIFAAKSEVPQQRAAANPKAIDKSTKVPLNRPSCWSNFSSLLLHQKEGFTCASNRLTFSHRTYLGKRFPVSFKEKGESLDGSWVL